jgi:hypothetical protein
MGLIICWANGDARNENCLSSVISSEKANLQDPGPHASDDASAAIANTMLWIEVAKDHDGTTDFEREMSQGQSRTVDGVEMLYWIHKLSIWLLAWCIVGKGVCTVVHPFLSRELAEDIDIELVHIIIAA